MKAGLLRWFLIAFCAHAAPTLGEAALTSPSATTPATEAASVIPEVALNQCLQAQVTSAAASMTLGELRHACTLLYEQQQRAVADQAVTPTGDTLATDIANQPPEERLLKRRLTLEALNRSNRFMLTPHRINYFFPASYTRTPNESPYRAVADESLSELKNTEAEFQLSVKILLREDIFGDNGHLYLGYTNHSLWQVYSDIDSAPFRETNHQPEFILSFSNDWEILGFRNVLNDVSLNHQSNGQGGLLSRSWNRVVFNSVFERGNFAFALSPWYRLPEPAQRYPGDPDGDDNPDITDYIGDMEVTAAYQHRRDIFTLVLRDNFSSATGGALELGWSFPISTNLRGQFRYFNGYGHSLIDYNVDLEVFALGIVFTDLF